MHILEEYYEKLYHQFGNPGPWPWFQQDSPYSIDEIIISAVLTQYTHWNNVQKVMQILRNHQILCLQDVLNIYHEDPQQLEHFIYSSGFYHQKAKKLASLAEMIFIQSQSINKYFQQPLNRIRRQLLSIKGIGPETADTILLYAGNKRIFVIDKYTYQFCQIHDLWNEPFHYLKLQKYFINSLPKQSQLYQNYHALIVQWAKSQKRLIDIHQFHSLKKEKKMI